MTAGALRTGAALILCVATGTAVTSWTGPAHAVEVEDVAGEPLTIDVTNTAIGNYFFDNRNSSEGATAPSTVVDDDYGEFIDHLNVNLFYWRFRVGVRIDGYAYGGLPDEFDLQEIAKERLPSSSGVERYEYENAFRRELHTRFKHTIYPTKLSVGYTAPGVDITLGDFYAQLGRGMVLSVRKIDELAQDTTIRGAKVAFKKSWEDSSLSITALAGQANPLRVDDQSGRRLHGDGSPLFFGFPSADDLTFYTFDEQGGAGYQTVPARPSYLEDTIYGLSVEAGPRQILFGAHASLVQRKSYAESNARCEEAGGTNCSSLFPTFETNNFSRLHERILTASGSVRVPNIFGHGDLYAEAAVQHNGDGRVNGVGEGGALEHVDDLTGYGIYVTGSIRGGPVSVTLEGKHYRSLLPLSGNINADGASDPSFAAPEFDTVVYNQPPNADTFYQEPIGSPNVCITGGRARADYQATSFLNAYGWVGYYVSQSEVNVNNTSCETDDPTAETHTIDAATGGDIVFDEGKSHLKAWVGGRNTVRAEPVESVNLGGESDAFYREGYVRYDIAKHLAGDFTLVSQGFHRHRYEPTLSPNWWNEGENYLALRWAPYFSFIFGFEYLGRRGCSADEDTGTCFYFSGGAQFKSAGKGSVAEMIFDTVSLFVGQRRGAIRCVAGVCRPFPPFEGAKLEVTSRF